MTEEQGLGTAIRTQIPAPHSDQVLAAIAAAQHGVASREQLAGMGLTPSLLKRRVASGHLVPLHRGVYAVGHAQLRREGHWLAAVLAVGPEAALSHRDAAALHCLRASRGSRIDVSTSADRRAAAGPIRIHGQRALAARDVTVVDAIPVTTVARTLVDLAGVVPRQTLSKALSEAERLNVLDVRAIEDVLSRVRGRRGPGIARLRATLETHAALGATLTRSELEDRFVALLDAHHIPRPRLNAWIAAAGVEVDALWPTERLAVELDGYAHHSHRRAFERDREKANALVDLGYRVLRFTHRHVVHEPDATARRVKRALYPSA